MTATYTPTTRLAFIADWLRADCAVAALSSRHAISRKMAYDWIARYLEEGAAGLRTRSRAPLRPHSVTKNVRDAVVALRLRHPAWGARALRRALAEMDPVTRWPAPSTIGELLKREGLVAETSSRTKLQSRLRNLRR